MDATRVSRKKKIAVIAVIVIIFIVLGLGEYYHSNTHDGNMPVVTMSSDGSFTYAMTSTFGDGYPEERGTVIISVYDGAVLLTVCDLAESTMTDVPEWASDGDGVSFIYDDDPASTGIGSKNSILNDTYQGENTTTEFDGECIDVCYYTKSVGDIDCRYLADDCGTIYEIVVSDGADNAYRETFTLIDKDTDQDIRQY